MKYVGSKGRHAKQILPIILKGRMEGQAYVEPFVGGANTIQHVGGRRVAGDLHSFLIAMWKEVSKDYFPPLPHELSEYRYNLMKKLKSTDTRFVANAADVGFMGFAMSYGGKWFGGYRRDNTGKRDHAKESHESALKEFPKLRGVEFHLCSYDALPIPEQSIIYCDPPYQSTLSYSTGGFDHAAFWNWVRTKVSEGHRVFVSEYAAPDDFRCVWEKSVKNTLAKNTGEKSGTERLFVHESQID